MIIPRLGGRGKTVPYKVSTVSVPVDIIGLIKRICHLYRDFAVTKDLDFAKQQVTRINDAIDIVESQQEDTPIHLAKAKLEAIIVKIDCKESGYKKNSASQLILELQELAKLL
jgi:hypothetical protein